MATHSFEIGIVIIKASLLTILAASVVAFTVYAIRPTYIGNRKGHADEDYIQSKNCLACHTDHFASWSKTYHSRMTQEANANSVQGDFEKENTLEFLGVKARMEKRAGRFSMTFNYADGKSQTFSIDRTVGSRRMEQYLTKQTGQYTRLPLAYDLTNKRWMSLNGSFFYPDGNNYFQHQAQWDGNCVFCHNVKAQPHLNTATKQYDTEVSELGIACGACHGAAAKHAEKATSPLQRTFWRLFSNEDRQIINPKKLAGERSLQVCGHCHGQRVPEPNDRILDILQRGDPFDAGEDLMQFYKPVHRETLIGSYSFANRFWANGSPRLTAFEYQGILRSRCFTQGKADNKINCLTCHSMHEGDVKGQITEENRTNKPCLQCHEQFEGAANLIAHTKHRTDSPGSRCYDCHMPRVVYGVMAVHPTHDITIPNPQMTATQAVPNACNQCHLDKSVNWAIAESKRLWSSRFSTLEIHSDKQFEIAEGARALYAGDALARALAAEALSGGGPAKPDERWALPFLLEALNDNYPIVRYFAANGLAKIDAKLPKPDYLGTPETRQQSFIQWQRAIEIIYPQANEQAKTVAQLLRTNRKDVDIEVGE
jgi:predicted CXXCH cytochrome family protein